MRVILIIILIILGLYMMFLGFKANILPPSVTGIGFIVIALLFAIKDKK